MATFIPVQSESIRLDEDVCGDYVASGQPWPGR